MLKVQIKCIKCGPNAKTEQIVDIHEPNYAFMNSIREAKLFERNEKVKGDFDGKADEEAIDRKVALMTQKLLTVR